MKKTFSEFELEILRVLWEIESGTTRDIFDGISRERKVAQPSVNVAVSLMLKKGVLAVIDDRRPQKYVPAKGIRVQYDAEIKQVARRLFGPKRNFMLNLLSGKHSAAEREQAKKLIDELE